MNTVSSSILINVPPENIFDYIINPNNTIRFFPYMKQPSGITPQQPGLNQTFNWTYSMIGIDMQGKAVVSEFVRPRKYTISSTGDIESTWIYEFEETNEGTKVSLTIIYNIKHGMAGKIIDAIALGRLNQKALEESLENLKIQLGE
jgi:carbon monoxide dehydrogenase subunit G